jgi:hypothetical protein
MGNPKFVRAFREIWQACRDFAQQHLQLEFRGAQQFAF